MNKFIKYFGGIDTGPIFGKLFLVLFVFLLLSGSGAFAATRTWVGPNAGGLWTTAANWSGGAAPAAGDDVVFNTVMTGDVTAVPTISLNSLTASSGATATLEASAGGNTITVSGSLTVESSATLTLGIGTTGTRLNFTLASTATGNINGTGRINFYAGGGGAPTVTFLVNGNLAIASNALLINLTSGSRGNFTLSSGATLQIANALGITTGATGAIQGFNTYSYNTGANYVYNASGAQATGSGLPTAAITGNVTVSNGANLTSTNAIIANGRLTVNGTLIPGAATQVFSGSGTLEGTGTVQVNRTAATADFLSQYTESTKNLTNLTVEYTVLTGGQVVSAATYNNLKLDNTSGTETVGGNVTVNGALTTTAGGTLNMGTNQLLGSLTTITNNGTIRTQNTGGTPIPAGKTWGGTVQYDSASGQTVVNGDYNNLTASGGSRTLTFNAGTTQTIEATLTLTGSAGNL